MRKLLIYITFFVGFFVFMSDTKASCTYTRMAELKKMASNVNVTYTYTIKDNKATFDIRFANLTNDISLYDSYNDKNYIQKGEVILSNFQDGQKYRFFIKSNYNDCRGEVLLTKYVTLPKYNTFYGDPLCEGIEDYVLCQRWGSFNITNHYEYEVQINKYKASLIKEKKENIEEKEETFLQKVGSFLLKYYIFILLGIIIICSTLIYFLRKKDRFDF